MKHQPDSDYRASLSPDQRALFDAQAKARTYAFSFWYLLGFLAFGLFIAYHNR